MGPGGAGGGVAADRIARAPASGAGAGAGAALMRRADPLPVRLYRRALVILPGRFRREHGPAMVAMLRDEWCDVRGSKRLRVLASSALDLVWTAIAERTSRSSGRRSHAKAGSAAGEPGAEARRLRLNVSWLDVRL